VKAILQFTLPEEQDEHRMALHGQDWALSMWDLEQELRKWLKYGHEFASAEEALEAVRECLYQALDERHLSLDMMH
jgi:hypothetical protein